MENFEDLYGWYFNGENDYLKFLALILVPGIILGTYTGYLDGKRQHINHHQCMHYETNYHNRICNHNNHCNYQDIEKKLK